MTRCFQFISFYFLESSWPQPALAWDRLREINLVNLKRTPQSRVVMGLSEEGGQTAATISVSFLWRMSEMKLLKLSHTGGVCMQCQWCNTRTPKTLFLLTAHIYPSAHNCRPLISGVSGFLKVRGCSYVCLGDWYRYVKLFPSTPMTCAKT